MQLSNLINKTGYYGIKVIPNQAQTKLVGKMDDGTIKISLNAAPEKGRANRELIAFISKSLKISKDDIRITAGLTSRKKVLHVEI